jgi:hypothetical protein
MHGPINVKSPNNISEWQMGFNSAFKALNKHIIEEIVRQDGYLPELYQNARSEKKYLNTCCSD